LEQAFAQQKQHEQQQKIVEEKRREQERLQDAKKREHERILEVREVPGTLCVNVFYQCLLEKNKHIRQND